MSGTDRDQETHNWHQQLTVSIHCNREQKYDILIGHDQLEVMVRKVASDHPANQYAIITDDRVHELYGRDFLKQMESQGLPCHLLAFPEGEESKDISTLIRLADQLLHFRMDRNSALIALGGGVVGDLAGLLASVYMRGVPVIHIPTTLLAQVDSSIGGKTAINLPRGKNLLGTFHQPCCVFIDIKFLDTLPEEEYQNGLAEIIKHAIIRDIGLFEDLENSINRLRDRDPILLESIIARSCAIKKAIVEEDVQERGVRRILNYGHTLGHAIELVSGFKISHGNAVAIGMIAITKLSVANTHLPEKDGKRIVNLIQSFGLDFRIPRELSIHDIISAMRRDKKKDGEHIKFVMLKQIGDPVVRNGLPEDSLVRTIDGMKA